MSYPYSQLKVVVTGDVLSATDYNAEHQNHITYAVNEIGPVYSVKVYGATGNGSTDDRTTITTADAATNGASLYFPPGTYLVGNNLTISSPVAFASGAMLSVASGKTVTFSSTIIAPVSQIFSGSGAVILGANTGSFVYPEWFGALCNGSNDDALATQAAVTAMTKGGIVKFGPRPYTFKTAVTVSTHSITLEGSLGTAPIDSGGLTVGTQIIGTNGVAGIIANAVDYFTMQDINLSLPVGATSACVGLLINLSFYPRVDHVRITNYSTSIKLVATADSYISNCYLSGTDVTVNPSVGLDINGTSHVQNPSVYVENCISAAGTFTGAYYGYWLHGNRISDVHFTNCEADGCTYGFFIDGSAGVDAGASEDIILQGCVADGTGTYGFYISTCTGDSIINIQNGWSAQGSIGVYVATSYGVTISGMQCYGQTGQGIYVGASSKDCSVIGNTIRYAGSQSIVIDGSPNCTVANNLCLGNSSTANAAIALIAGATYASIMGNVADGPSAAFTTGILTPASCDFGNVLGNEMPATICSTPYTLNLGSNTHTTAITPSNPLQVANGGTNSSTALANGKLMASSGGAVIESAVTSSTTGSGNVVLATSPTLVTPVLGTPTSGTLTNCTGTASGLTAGNVTTNANLTGVITSVGNATSLASQTGTGSKFVVDTSPTLVTPLLGTPTSGALTNCTSIPVANATGTLAVSHGGTGQTALSALVPTIQKFTSSSGTYTTPAGCTWVAVRMVGGGGGGAGSGTAGGTAATDGGNTTFGTSLLIANGGVHGVFSSAAGAGGTASLGTGPAGVALQGAAGVGGFSDNGSVNVYGPGGSGGSSPFGGAGANTQANVGGGAAVTNSGSGGAGGSGVGAIASTAGSGGGAGGYVDAIITSPSASYAYAVGTAGSAGGAGTSGFVGGAGGSGLIIVEEHYI